MKLGGILLAVVSLPAAFAAGNAQAGKAVYDRSCKGCHGADGVANPGMAKMMKVPIPNLGSAEVQRLSDAEIKKVVTDGKGKMPAIHNVSGSSLDDVVAFVRTLKK